jgi:hypothetical protein
MLVSERAAVLRVASQAQLIDICGAQIVACGAAMCVVAIHAFHLPFAQRVMVRQAHLSTLSLMAAQAGIVRLP